MGQDGHGGTKGTAQPPSVERPSKTDTLIPPLNTSGSCGAEPPVYAHRSPKSPGVGCHHHHHHLLPPQEASRSTCSVTLGGHCSVPHRRRSSLSQGRRRALAERTQSEIPSRGCPWPRARLLPAQAAPGEGGIGAAGLT